MKEDFKFKREIVRSFYSGELIETTREVIYSEYINNLKTGISCNEAMNNVADVIGCSKRTVVRVIRGG